MPRTLFVLLAAGLCAGAQAASFTTYNSLAAWQAAITGAAQGQDFSSFNANDSLVGVELLPGVTLSTNLTNLRVFGVDKEVFGGGRAGLAENAYYQANYALPYRAVAFDIASFESIQGDASTADGPGTLTLNFSDGSTSDLLINGGLGANIFFGVIADFAVTSWRWNEALEGNKLGNEETSLDNFYVAMRGDNQVPLPGSLALALLGLALLPRRRAQ